MNKDDRIFKKLVDHEEKLQSIEENMATKNDMNKVMTALDEVLVITRRLDQERIFTQSWIKRLEDNVKENTRDIIKMKKTFKIV